MAGWANVAVLRTALGLTILALVFLGLTPFAFAPANDAHWEGRSSAALVFSGRGLAYSEGTFGKEEFKNGDIRIEFSLEPAEEPGSALGTILAFEDGRKTPPLLIAQWKRSLIVRVRDSSGGDHDYWEISSEPRLLARRRHQVRIVSRRGRGTSLEIDGHSALHRTRSLLGPGTAAGSRLVIGCRRNGSAGWSGRLFSLALYERAVPGRERADDVLEAGAVGYDFSGNPGGARLERVPDRVGASSVGALLVPPVFSPLVPDFLSWPSRRSLGKRWFVRDLMQNILGFIPLGVLAALSRAKKRPRSSTSRTVFVVTTLGAALSFAIEVLQVVLPGRNSSLLDWLLNTGGTVLGALLGLAIMRTKSWKQRE